MKRDASATCPLVDAYVMTLESWSWRAAAHCLLMSATAAGLVQLVWSGVAAPDAVGLGPLKAG